MIKTKFKKSNAEFKSLQQNATYIQRVRIKEFFPENNSVTVRVIDNQSSLDGSTVTDQMSGTDYQFPLGYRGDVSESMAPQPGEVCYLIHSGSQYKTGFVILAYSPGGDRAMKYTPLRGGWALG